MKSVNKSVVATIINSEYKNVLLNNKCLILIFSLFKTAFLSSYKNVILIIPLVRTAFPNG